MKEYEQNTCPRCKIAFECKVGSIMVCQCTTVCLNQEERAYIKTFYNDCLCTSCMTEMKNEFQNHQVNNNLKLIPGGCHPDSKK